MMEKNNVLANNDMKTLFKVGEEVICSRRNSRGLPRERGKIIGVSDFLIIVEFSKSKESYTFFDYHTGKVEKV